MFGHVRTTVGSWDVEKVHAVVARSEAHVEVTFGSQNVQNTPFLDHFWKLRCRKSARRSGVKHISKSKRTKPTRFGTLFEARFEVKSKKWRVGSTFGRSDVVLRGRHKGFCTLPKVRKTWEFWSSFNYDHHYTTLHYTTLHSTTTTTTTTTSLHYTNYIALHELHYTSTTLHYITLHYANYNYNYTTLHYTDYITLHYMTPHWTTPHHTTLTTTTATTTTILLYTTLHYTRVHYITLPYIILHYSDYTTYNCNHFRRGRFIHYTHYKCNCNYTTQISLHHNCNSTTQHYNYSCTTPHYIQQLWVRWPTRWPLQPLQPFQTTQLQPPFNPWVDSLCHPWFTTTSLS